MSKKKKKNKNKKWYSHEYNYAQKKAKKNKKKMKNDGYKKPEFKTRNESLGKKDIRAAHKIVTATPEVSKKLMDIQQNCNHAGNLITIQEYKDRSLTPSAYTPKMEAIAEVFGKNALICESCYQVVVDPAGIDPAKLREALAYLHGAATAVLPRKKFKDKEIRKINDLADDLSKWNEIISLFEKMSAKGAFNSASKDIPADADLNSASNAKAFFMA